MAGKGKGGVFGMALGLDDPELAEDSESEVDDGLEGEALTAAADEVRAAMEASDSERFRDGLKRFVQLCREEY